MKFKIIAFKDWIKNHPEDLPARIILIEWNKAGRTEYSSHIQVQYENGTKPLFLGHYFFSRIKAEVDFNNRTLS